MFFIVFVDFQNVNTSTMNNFSLPSKMCRDTHLNSLDLVRVRSCWGRIATILENLTFDNTIMCFFNGL